MAFVMGRIRTKRRKQQIKIKRKRSQKLTGLRQAYSKAKTKEAKDKILAKARRLAPWLSQEEFLSP